MKNNFDVIIIGSGVGGLSAACWAKKIGLSFIVIEWNKDLILNLKNGVHYLHNKPELPFDPDLKTITLTDGILKENGFIQPLPSLNDALEYSEKVREIQHPSSIFEVGQRKEVYITQNNSLDDLLLQMYEYSGKENFLFSSQLIGIDVENKNIEINTFEDKIKLNYKNILLTIPLPKLIELTNSEKSIDSFYSNPIKIINCKVNNIVPNWLINLYIPSPKEKIYRMSILNNLMSSESVDELDSNDILHLKELFKMFYIDISNPTKYEWKQGKIISISIDYRKKILEQFIKNDIYTIGRFGLWNSKLLVDSTINQAKICIDCITENIGKKELTKKLTL